MVSRIIRRTHMYLGLFLVPWVVIYATSTIIMNHHLHTQGGDFEVQETHPYTAEWAEGEGARVVGRRVLDDLSMGGDHNAWGSLEEGKLTILRRSPVETKRITYLKDESKLTMEGEGFELSRLLQRLHVTRGYDRDYIQNDLWGVSVEIFAFTMVFWAASGIWLWWELKVTRRIGLISAASGFVLLAIFLATI